LFAFIILTACSKFGQLILRKITEIVVTRYHIYLFIYLFISTDAMTTKHDNQRTLAKEKQLSCNKWWTARRNKEHLLLPI